MHEVAAAAFPLGGDLDVFGTASRMSPLLINSTFLDGISIPGQLNSPNTTCDARKQMGTILKDCFVDNQHRFHLLSLYILLSI